MRTIKKGIGTRGVTWRTDVITVCLAAVTAFLAIALFFHNPSDASWLYHTSGDATTTNKAGVVGAHVASILVYFFGASSVCILFLFGLWTYMSLTRRSWAQEWDRFSALLVLMGVIAALCNAHHVDFLASACPGGLCGALFYKQVNSWFDSLGGMLALYVLLAICMLVLTRASLLMVLKRGVNLVRSVACRRVMRVIVHVVGVGLQALVQPIIYLIRWYSSLFNGSLTSEVEQLLSMTRYGVESAGEYEHASGPGVTTDTAAIPSEVCVLLSNTSTQDSVVVAAATSQAPESEKINMTTSLSIAAVSPKVAAHRAGNYVLPSTRLLAEGKQDKHDDVQRQRECEEMARLLEEKLVCFGVNGSVVAIKQGPVVILFEYQPDIDTKISKIIALEDDLALALQAMSIRIIAPIPGRSVVGFEVASRQRLSVSFGEVIRSSAYQKRTASLPLALGKDTVGNNVVVDLVRMPHLLVAGATGSGKSVGLHSMIMSLLFALRPDELKIILIDPKRLEFAAYANIGHLLFPIVTDPKQAVPALTWIVKEMERRYARMAEAGARTMHDYNNRVANQEYLPYIVVIIDEFSDLMMTVGKAAEDLIVRITQMARAAGIHMIVATQRPSVDVITGLIKVNFPSRIAFKVTAKVDSRTILDCVGADKLLGRGDMLFLDASESTLKRVHGAYVSDAEIQAVAHQVKTQRAPSYQTIEPEVMGDEDLLPNDQELFQEIVAFLQKVDEISISLLQRKFRVGYNRSARIIDMLEARGMIMPSDGGKMRKVIK